MKKFFKVLKWIILAGVTIAGAVFATKIIRKATIGLINKQRKFLPVPGKPNLINIIKEDGTTEVVELPKGWKYKDIKAAGISKTGSLRVEIKHEKISIRDSLDKPTSTPDDYTRGGRIRSSNEG